MKKRGLCLALGVIMMFSQAMSVGAVTQKEKLQNEKKATQSQLEVQETKIQNLENQKSVLSQEIDQLDADLVNVLVEINILEGELTSKEKEIETTESELVVAEKDRDEQYQAMKKRIQYLYENGGENAWTQMIFASEDFASMLNHAEYVQRLYSSDRKALDTYKEAVKQVEDLKESLATEKADMEMIQTEYENQKANLEVQLTEKKATSSDYENQIQVAQSQAAEFTALIRRQNAEIRRIEEEEKRAAEEKARKEAEERARKAAEERARREAEEKARKEAEERARRQAEENARREEEQRREQEQHSNNNGGGSSANDSSSGGNRPAPNTPAPNTPAPSTPEPTKPAPPKPAPEEDYGSVPYNPTGQAVVDFALQFVGNPYVYGGTSLTHGTDCSGFTQSIYAHFGVHIPRSSASQRTAGVGVSYAEAMPGDIICYSGHVALYMGGGAIVHASNERDGIKISPSATYRPILTVRRVL